MLIHTSKFFVKLKFHFLFTNIGSVNMRSWNQIAIFVVISFPRPSFPSHKFYISNENARWSLKKHLRDRRFAINYTKEIGKSFDQLDKFCKADVCVSATRRVLCLIGIT